MTSDADKIRIAIALTALKFKPPDQSISSYVLDLQARFPPSSSTGTTDSSWRSFALSLERDHAALQAKYEAEHIKLLALENAASSMPAEPSGSASSKKKAKKKPLGTAASKIQPSRLNLKTVLDGCQDQKADIIPTISRADSLFSSVNDILELTSLHEPRPDLLLSVTIRVVDAVHRVLEGIVVRSTPNVSSDLGTLQTLRLLLYNTLATVLPLLAQERTQTRSTEREQVESVDGITHLLDRITALVLNKLIHAFSPITDIYLDALFDPPTGGVSNATHLTSSAGSLKPPGKRREDTPSIPLPADIRADMLSLFRTVFCVLDTHLELPAIAPSLYLVSHTLRGSLILETVRALEKLLALTTCRRPSPGDPGDGGGIDVNPFRYRTMGKPERVKKLAIKDSLWYLCAILHILFGGDPSSQASRSFYPTTFPAVPKAKSGNENERGGGGVSEAEVRWQKQTRDGDGRLLSEGVADALFRLVTRCKRTASSSRSYPHQLQGTPVSRTEGQWGMSVGTGGGGVHVAKEGRRDKQGQDDEGIDFNDASRLRGRMDGEVAEDSGLGDDTALDLEDYVGTGDSAAGQVSKTSGNNPDAASLPQYQPPLGTPDLEEEESRADERFELDEVGYGMLLGVIERYWVWSKRWEF